jgi:hypothetical protein
MNGTAQWVALIGGGFLFVILSFVGRDPIEDLVRMGDELVAAQTAWRIMLRAAGVIGMAGGSIMLLMYNPDATPEDLILPALAAILAFVRLVMAVRPQQVRIAAYGVVVRSPFRECIVGWAALEADEFALPDAGLDGVLVRGERRRVRRPIVRIRKLAVEPQRLLDAIVFNRDYPQWRVSLPGWNPVAAPERLPTAPSQYIPPGD